MTHQQWLELAERVDSFRIFPRLFLLGCFTWSVILTHVLVQWYIHLAAADQNIQASGFGAVVFTANMAFLKMVYQTYSDAGRNWSTPLSQTTTTVATQQTVQK